MRTYHLTESKSDSLVTFVCNLDGTTWKGEAEEVFKWMINSVGELSIIPVRVVILGFLGKSVDRTFYPPFTSRWLVKQVFKSWYAQSVQAKAAVARQRISVQYL